MGVWAPEEGLTKSGCTSMIRISLAGSCGRLGSRSGMLFRVRSLNSCIPRSLTMAVQREGATRVHVPSDGVAEGPIWCGVGADGGLAHGARAGNACLLLVREPLGDGDPGKGVAA
jgi:hypothetical protein